MIVHWIKTKVQKLVNYYLFYVNNVYHSNFNINGIIFIQNKGKISIGNNFSANSGKSANPIGGDTILRLIVFKKTAELSLGKNVGISNSTIVCWNKIFIGDNVVIGGSCKIWDTDFHSLDPTIRVSGNDNNIKTNPIYIDDNVFIGSNCLILKGVTIGKNSIIAAGSIVSKSIPPNVIAGGNPCKIIKDIN